jgi:hypothetical protein
MNIIKQKSAMSTVVKASVLAGTALLAVPVLSTPAEASGRVVAAASQCATGRIEVKVKADNGRLEVEGEVDTNRRGQTWNWTIRRNGNVAASGTNTTRAPSGSFSVNRHIANPAGTDTIRFRAVRPATGQVCSVSVRF